MNNIFMQNYYCHIKDNIYFIVISRNACTTLKNIALREHLGYYPDDINRTHMIIGHEENKFLKSFNSLPENSLKFAVYRDPVDRLISVYKHFCLDNATRWYFDALDLRDVSFDRFMEFVRFELTKKNPLMQDEHIRRQRDYYNLNDIDIIVKQKDLNYFLLEKNIVPLKDKYNMSTESSIDIDDSVIQEIKDLYSDDYNIIKSDKIYKNNL